MISRQCPIISIVNQKGGVGKTTTTINLAHALALYEHKVLVVDLDPQSNATQGLNVSIEEVEGSISNLLSDPKTPIESAIYKGSSGIDLIPATPKLSSVALELAGITNSYFRLITKLKEVQNQYSAILLDTAPGIGTLTRAALNASSHLVVPIDSSFFALMGVKELLFEIEQIKYTNPNLKVLGYLLTLTDHTNMTRDTLEDIQNNFTGEVFEATIRRTVKLRECSALGKTIFQHDPNGVAANDYLRLCEEVLYRLNQYFPEQFQSVKKNPLEVIEGGSHV